MNELDPVIHQPVRLRIMASLAALEKDACVEFTFLRDHLHLTDGNLGAHLAKLETAGHIVMTKTFEHKKPITRIALSSPGRNAFDAYVATLQSMINPGAAPDPSAA